MSNKKIPQNPLQKIALSCSGGGYRAASFHLGAMSYLNRLKYFDKPLLENVKLISTVSGGTITGAVYALKKQEGKSFGDIYAFLMDKLRQLDLVKMGIEKLNPEGEWNNLLKRKNLINAFAELYDRYFTEGATFSVFNSMKSHIEAVIFNSTDFDHGVNFRFRNLASGIFGNNYHRVDADVAGEVKIADAIAASSCFTGGFEPIVWPQDFVYEEAAALKRYNEELKPVGLMDGGIYDNQGIDSVLMYKKNNEDPYFDLVIISDVSSPYMDAFKPAADNPKEGIRKLTVREFSGKVKRWDSIINLSFIVLIILFGLLPLSWGYSSRALTTLSLGISIGLLFLFISKNLLVSWLKSAAISIYKKIIKKVPLFYVQKLSRLKIEDLSIRRVEPLLSDRINSLITLVMDVFLKVVRRLNYTKIYENDNYQYRRISNLIRELTQVDFEQREGKVNTNIASGIKSIPQSILIGTYDTIIGDKIKTVAETASGFGTTLWFTEEQTLNNMLDNLVAAGQFTMCYNMLEYMEIIIFEGDNGFNELNEVDKNNLTQIYNQCKADWAGFRIEPFFMVKPA
jgi:predicted acylesterase/phospholipase RssA